MLDELCVGMKVEIYLKGVLGQKMDFMTGTLISKSDRELVLERPPANQLISYFCTIIPTSLIGSTAYSVSSILK